MHPDIMSITDTSPYLERAQKGSYFDMGRIGNEKIDDFLRFKEGEFIVCTGHANVGKTHTMFYLMLMQSITHGKKWLCYAAENEVHSIQRKLIEFLHAKPINLIPEARMHSDLCFIDEYFKFINPNKILSAFELLNIFNEVLNEWPYTGAFVDPYNSLRTDQSILGKISMHEYHYEVASAFRVFSHKEQVTLIVSTHPVTEAMRKVHHDKHEYARLPMPVGIADIEGGGKWGNRSDCVVVIHRYSGHATDWKHTHIHVRKVKETETGGRITPYDNPIVLTSMMGNVGFTIDGQNLLNCVTI